MSDEAAPLLDPPDPEVGKVGKGGPVRLESSRNRNPPITSSVAAFAAAGVVCIMLLAAIVTISLDATAGAVGPMIAAEVFANFSSTATDDLTWVGRDDDIATYREFKQYDFLYTSRSQFDPVV